MGQVLVVTPVIGRPTCRSCHLHANICVCAECAPVANTTPITVIQHPSEFGHSKGTVRILEQCLAQVRVVVGETPGQLQRGGLELPDSGAAMLFPGPGSKPLEQADLQGIRHWVVVDGTWRKAAKILHLNPNLSTLPQYHFAEPPQSRYVIRKAPADHHLSTAEAAAHLLRIVEPTLDVTPVDTAMVALVDRLLAQIPAHLRNRYPGSEPN